MTKLAANLSLLFTELPFLDRFAAAAAAGFAGVEFMFPYDHPAEAIAESAAAAGVEIVLFNMPAGDWAAGERGFASLPERSDECRAATLQALDYARVLGTHQLHLLAGKADRSATNRAALVDAVRFAADHAAPDGIDILLEPINTRVDIPGYFYDGTATVEAVMAEIDRPNVRMQYDIYHMQIMEGDILRTVQRLLPIIGHIQIADNPGRGEPGTGELNYPMILERIDALGYEGWVGCEYKPQGETLAGLGWAQAYLAGAGRVAA